jgi:succinylarginine dihydrolase
MRLTTGHGEPGLEIFVYGKSGGRFPARQHQQASRIVARRHGLDPARVLFVEQSPEAIAAGAFHNDVVAVANERVLFCHEKAFADRRGACARSRALSRGRDGRWSGQSVSLAEAVRSYLFNAQLVTCPRASRRWWSRSRPGKRAGPRVPRRAARRQRPDPRVVPVDVRQSMANGGGPACLRLRGGRRSGDGRPALPARRGKAARSNG